MTIRPAILNPLFAKATVLPGVGARTAAAVEHLAGPLVVHLLWHLPWGLIDRRHAPKVADAEAGTTATLTVRIDSHRPSPDRRRPTKVLCSDETGFITLVFFHAKGDWLRRSLCDAASALSAASCTGGSCAGAEEAERQQASRAAAIGGMTLRRLIFSTPCSDRR